MAANCFVRPERVTLHLANGHTIAVKKRLNAGELRQLRARLYPAAANGERRLDLLQIDLARLTTYLIDWSCTDEAGVVVPIFLQPIETVEAAVNRLEPELQKEMCALIEAHEATQIAAREAEKKTTPTGAITAPAISPSPSAPDGASNGSGNSIQMTTPSSSTF